MERAAPRILTRERQKIFITLIAESGLYSNLPKIFNRVTHTQWLMDDLYWLKFPTNNKQTRVQIEIIDYDTDRIGKEATFNEHIDNYSVVTMIAMLSDPEDFEGGRNSFRINGTVPCYGTDADAPTMTLKLEKGDAVFFRGEVVPHGITPVTSGRRVILQSEMHVPRDDDENGEIPGVDCRDNDEQVGGLKCIEDCEGPPDSCEKLAEMLKNCLSDCSEDDISNLMTNINELPFMPCK
ncbi:hypothetical protein TrVE_jg3052 [Triparma verrucosa]|uniref:Prolyl 4-hydroxylase alpha subunit Fe(2+) 2OG dioxygenase domain-containing protein n=1 Tax=Triparma verrucosa TaxID=1606542 RepID=A0A9W6Z7X6_9STRA|nr:hypothetical protein TrVE_jg3052 [Triparma verrucosa]